MSKLLGLLCRSKANELANGLTIEEAHRVSHKYCFGITLSLLLFSSLVLR